MITIIDYGAGNLRSVANAIAKLGYEPTVTSSPSDALKGDAVIFPGVGAAGDTMHSLEESGMANAIRRLIAEERPLFAICVGMQVMISGTVEGTKKLKTGMKVKVDGGAGVVYILDK